MNVTNFSTLKGLFWLDKFWILKAGNIAFRFLNQIKYCAPESKNQFQKYGCRIFMICLTDLNTFYKYLTCSWHQKSNSPILQFCGLLRICELYLFIFYINSKILVTVFHMVVSVSQEWSKKVIYFKMSQRKWQNDVFEPDFETLENFARLWV